MTPAQKNMLVGGGICLVGVAVTVVTYQAAKGGGTYTVAYGAIAVGAIQFLYGLFKHLGDKSEPATGPNLVMLALHAMAYVASGDGKISDREIATMEMVLKRIAGVALPAELHERLRQFGRVAPDETVGFDHARKALTKAQKETILQCAVMAALSDGEIAGAGAERLARVGLALGLALEDQQVVVHRISSVLDKRADGGAAAAS